jgi:hypothetical protein
VVAGLAAIGAGALERGKLDVDGAGTDPPPQAARTRTAAKANAVPVRRDQEKRVDKNMGAIR